MTDETTMSFNDERPTHLDLCSGTGAFSIAFEREGFETIGFSEIEDFPCQLLKQNWPGVRNYGDLRTIPAIPSSVITAGDPCQPFSVAGRKLGAADDRHLWPAVLAVVQRCQPDFFLGENVTGIANMVLSRRIDELAESGYQSVAFDIPSCGVGLSTMERHIWLVAARTKVGLAATREGGLPGKRLAERRQGRQESVERGPIANGFEGWPERWLLPEPRMLRSSKGFSAWKHRIEAIGNAVPVPIAQIFARAIYQQIA